MFMLHSPHRRSTTVSLKTNRLPLYTLFSCTIFLSLNLFSLLYQSLHLPIRELIFCLVVPAVVLYVTNAINKNQMFIILVIVGLLFLNATELNYSRSPLSQTLLAEIEGRFEVVF